MLRRMPLAPSTDSSSSGDETAALAASAARDAVRQRRRDRDVTLDDRQRSSLEISDDDIDIPSFLRED